jgi:hypothetical protein
MSIGALAIAEAALAGEAGAKTTVKKPPRTRLMVAKADIVAPPEPR